MRTPSFADLERSTEPELKPATFPGCSITEDMLKDLQRRPQRARYVLLGSDMRILGCARVEGPDAP